MQMPFFNIKFVRIWLYNLDFISLYLFLSLFVSISLFFSLSFSFPSNSLFLSPFLSISPSPFFLLRSFPSLSLPPPLILLLIYNSCCVLKNLWFYCKVRILSITRNKDKFWRRMVFFFLKCLSSSELTPAPTF